MTLRNLWTQYRGQRRCSPGANLALLCGVAILIIAFLGISIYTGLEAFLESDLQRASMNAAMVGAAAYYSGNPTDKPTPDVAQAKQAAQSAFDGIVANSSLNGFNAATTSITNNDNNDSITVNSRVSLDLSLLAPVGINTLQVDATATARALRYEPTEFAGPLHIYPVTGNPGSLYQTINLVYPLVDGVGNDLYVEEEMDDQQGYFLEACNNTECYDLSPGITRNVGSSPGNVAGNGIIYGSVLVDIGKAGVHKASKLRITHSADFAKGFYKQGVLDPNGYTYFINPYPLTIKRIILYGYAGACADQNTCGVPTGFMPME